MAGMIATVSLALATLAFVGTHLAMSHPLRTRLVQNVGEQGFLALYSAVAFVTLVWMILSYRAVDESFPLWIAPGWAWPAASGVMLVACILLAGSFFRNPAFPHPGAKPEAPRAASGVFAVTRHPMNMAFILWALVHIALWGGVPNLIVAGGILVLAVLGSIGQDHKKLNVVGEPWRAWMGRTSFVPFGALLTGRAKWGALREAWPAVLIGLLLWLAITWLHAPEVSPIAALTR
ncbi:MAG TPA: NnrU family protein [Allosphingosinicella sp.]|nr:NnrU family protein [Allosphingosinicella sp.]